jgi:tetratricopeptide (TPR) repeat protein
MLLFVSACASVSTMETETEPAEQAPRVSQEQEPQTRVPPTRPNLELTEETLYKLLLAEIAGQRGHLDIAVENYLDLARSTRDPEIASRATRIAVYARDDSSAQEAAEIWVELDPENSDAHQVLAVMSIRQGDIEAALKHLEIILEKSTGLLDQKLWMIANLLSKEKDQEVVKIIMEQMMIDHQDDPEALYAYAHVMSRMGDNDRSRELLEKLLILVPDNQNAITSYVSILQKQGESNTAVGWLEKSLEGNDDDFNLRMIYARLLTDIQQFDDARRQFEILIVQAPNNTDVIYALGLLYLQVNRLDESERYFQRLSEQEQRADEASYYLGRIAEEKNDFERASSWYQGIQKGPNYFDAQIRAGILMAKQGKVDEARKHVRSIRTQGAEQQNLLIQAEGELLIEEGRYDDAIAVYDEALENRYNADLLYARAMLAEKMDRLDILERDLRIIIDKEPNHAQALNALGYTLADRTGRHEEAYEFIKQAMDLKPNDFYILDSMGWVLYRLGRLEESIEYLNKALNARNDPEIAAHLGEVLWVKGERDAAKKIWETALQETPEDIRLLDVIKRFNP